jgi:hypothetical protein
MTTTDPYRSVATAYANLGGRRRRRLELMLGLDLDDLIAAIRRHQQAPAASDDAIRTAVAAGAEAHLVVLHALVPELRRRIVHTATTEYHTDAISHLALVLLDSDLSAAGLVPKLISRAHNRALRAARSARIRGDLGQIAVDPCDPHVLDRARERRDVNPTDVADEATQRADLARFGQAVRAAIATGDVTEAGWTAYRDHRLRRALALDAGASTGAERVASLRASRRLAPLVSTHLNGHAA